VFPVRYELSFYMLFGRNSVFKGLTCLEMAAQASLHRYRVSHSRGSVSGYPLSCLRCIVAFSSSPHINYSTGPQIRSRQLSYICISIHYSLIIMCRLTSSHALPGIKKEVLGRTNRLLSLIRHGPY
jgi:hypothetical protein